MLYKLFSAVGRCAPCRKLAQDLDKQFPEWKEYIEYIDVDISMSKEQLELASKIGVRGLPSFTNDKKILYSGFTPNTVKKIKELCLTKE